MKFKKRISNKFLFLFMIAIFVLAGSGATALAAASRLQPTQGLFTPTATQGSLFTSQDQTITRTSYVDVNLALLDDAAVGDAILLNLYDDVNYVAILERKEPAKPDGYTWVGRLQGVSYSQVILVVGGGQMAGKIVSPLGQYQVRYAGNGVHAIYTLDQSKFPDELPPIPVAADAGIAPNSATAADACSAMDVMVVWTAQARSDQGGTTAIQNLVNLAVTEANQSYINSNMNQRVNLVHMEEVSYTQADFSTDLGRLQNPSDGYVDNVHSLRNTYYADLVSMFVSYNTTTCGIGYLMTSVSPSFESNAFTVVEIDCATGYYSFAHEMGHNQGARHDWYVDSNTTPYAYAHGYVYVPGLWRTIMAYNNACSPSNCTRIQYWSNPGISYNGNPTGVSGGSTPADNHLALNNTCSTVANFRDEPDPPGAFNKSSPSNGATGVSTSPTLSWGSSSGATSYSYCYDTSNNNTCNGSWTSTGTNTSVGLSGLSAGTTYSWHVRANNTAGTTYSNSDTWWSFTTQAPPPGAFNKTSPSNGATGISTSPTLSWGSSSNATSYEYCYDTSNNSTCNGSWTSTGSNTSVGLSGLSAGTTYSWHVRAINGGGTTYSSSDTWWSFTTTAAQPGAFNKTSPVNGATGVVTNPTLNWNASSGAASYEYCYDTTNNSACDGSWTSVGSNTNVGLSGLSLGTIYYWQVRAMNGSGTTYADSNSWWSFTVQSTLQLFVYLPYINSSTACTPLYTDDFSNSASGWPVGSSANVDYGYLSGEYRMYFKVTSVGFYVRPGFQADNFAASVVVRNVTNLDGSYGLMFGLSADWSEFYTYEIYADGSYEVWKYANSWTLLASGSSSDINTGTASNTLGVERNGSTINVYANGHFVDSVTDGTFTGMLYLGLTASAYTQANQDIRFDNFKVNDFSCGLPTAASRVPAQSNIGTGNQNGILPNYIILPAIRSK
jgi:hypothetical protein